MKITIGIPVHNATHIVKTCIERAYSACKYNDYDFQIIIIDDNSNQPTKEMLSELENNYVKIYHTEDYVDTPNPNLGWNMDFLFRQIRNDDDYYLNLESDVILLHDTIPNLISALECHSDQAFAAVPIMLGTDTKSINWANCQWGFHTPMTIEEIPETVLLDIGLESLCPDHLDSIPVACMLISAKLLRDKFTKINYTLGLWCCDEDFYKRMAFHTNKTAIFDKKAVVVHANAQSRKGNYYDTLWTTVALSNEAWSIISQIRKQKIKMTVGMPIHNALNVLKESIPALIHCLDYHYIDYQFIIIDDNSDNETKEYLKSLNYDNVKLYHTEDFISDVNPNLGWNVNFLLDHVREDDDYYLNIESDIIINEDTVPLLIGGLQKHQEAIAAHPILYKERKQNHFPIYDFDRLSDSYSNIPIKYPPTFGCLLIRGEIARDKKLRADKNFRLWYADVDYNRFLMLKTNRPILLAHYSHALHYLHSSSKGYLHQFPGVLGIGRTLMYLNIKWKRLVDKIEDPEIKEYYNNSIF